MDGNPFGPCREHLNAFNTMSGETGIPAVLLASIAMQESTCRAYVTGPNGEIGLMQITPDKCGGVGDCFEPYVSFQSPPAIFHPTRWSDYF